MDWTPCKGTWAAAHLPADAKDKCEEAFFRQVYIMKWHNVPPKVGFANSANCHENSNFSAQLNISFDQIGNHILPSNGYTFHNQGAKQVDIVAKDENCAYTLVQLMGISCHFSKFGQVPWIAQFLYVMCHECRMPLIVVLTSHLQRVIRKQVISAL